MVRIRAEVDPHLEITEIATRVVKQRGPALLFENIKGSSFPVVINVLGTEERLSWALGQSPDQIGEKIGEFAKDLMPPSFKKLWAHRSVLKHVLSMKTKSLYHPPVLAKKIEPANLDVIPIAQSWPKDGGPFITFPLVITKSPVDGKQNMGVYRMQKFSKDQTGMHWQIAKGGGYHYDQAERKNEPLPVAVALGGDPVLMLCGVMPLPEGMDELAFAGFLRGESTRTVMLKESNLRVPAEADFILEGHVAPGERRPEGPYGDHFGHYSHAAPFPVFEVSRIWHRSNAIYPIAVVGKPPQEDQVLGDAIQEIMLPLLKLMHPEIRDIWAYQEAGFHNLLVISVQQRFQKEGIKTGLWALGEGQLALTKCVILVDEIVSPRNFEAVLESIQRHFDPSEDFILLPHTSQDTLDFTSFKMNLGSKMILDATSQSQPKRTQVEAKIDLAQLQERIPEIQNVRLWNKTLLVIQVASAGREVLEKMIDFPGLETVSLVAAVSRDVPLQNATLLLWGLFTRFDCERDTFFKSASWNKGHPLYKGPLFIDATWKPGYPEPLAMTDEVIKKVDLRWKEYGIPSHDIFPSPNRSYSASALGTSTPQETVLTKME